MESKAEKIKSSVDIEEVIGRYIELKKNGPEYQACCPFHEEKTPSFSVVPNKGFYHCFGCGAHGDVIDFVMEYTKCSYKEAVASLSDGVLEAGEVVKKKSKRVDPYDPYTPVAKNGKTIKPGQQVSLINPKRDGQIWRAKPSMVHDYGPQGYVLRIDMDDGKKVTPMVRWCNGPKGEGWHCYPFDEPRPIYGYKEGQSQVLVVEGEKARDAIQAVAGDKITVVSWSGGTSGVEKTDWSPLSGRKIILWPDNDKPGFKAMAHLYGYLTAIADSVRLITPPEGLPKGWDGADKEWSSAQELFAWCKANASESPPKPEWLGEEVASEPEPKPEQQPEPPLPTEEDYGAPMADVVYLDQYGAVEDKPPATVESSESWKAELMFKDDGEKLVANVNNAQVLLSYHPDMKGVLGYNQFKKEIEIRKTPVWDTEGKSNYPRPLEDVDDTRATAWLERKGCKLTIGTVHNAIVSAAHHNPFNPLQDYLHGLEWDGKPRLNRALHRLLGCADNEYVSAVSRRFLIGAVARALNPGCKMDTMLILEGQQGLKKSTAVAALFGDGWFTDELGDLGSKDAAMQVQGIWCVEIAELATMNRAESNRIKEWITRRIDRFRPPYGRNIISAPRQCVLIGTVNPEGGYLKDATGGRRFWPVECTSINIEWIEKYRNLLWAEAVQAYKDGERWWFDHDERHIAEAEQEQRYESDPWDDRVSDFLKSRTTTSVSEIMETCLDLQTSNQNQIAQNRLAKILRMHGWKRKQRRWNGVRQWVYVNENSEG